MKYIDLGLLKEVTDQDKALMAELIRSFIDSVPKYIEDIELSAVREDWPALESALHQFDSALGYFGMKTISRMIEIAQHSISQNAGRQSLAEQIAKLKTVLAHSTAELRFFLDNLESEEDV